MLGDDEEIVAGRRPVEEAFAARREARRLLVVPERRAALDQLVLHATTLRIPVVEVAGGRLTAISGFDGHQGVALVVAPRRWATLEDVLALARTRGEPPFVLVLDRLEDPQNVGTLLRSAEASGVHGVLFPSRGAAPISPAAVKTSAGAVEHLLLVPLDDLPAGLVDLHTRGVRIVGADGDAPLTVRDVDMRGPLAIVVGSEGRGLEGRVSQRVDIRARIHMRGRVASLNASMAGSVFLFEAATQRAGQEAGPGGRRSTDEPAADADEPAADADERAADADEPAADAHDPAAGDGESPAPADEPGPGTDEPTAGADEPGPGTDDQPGPVVDDQPTALESESSQDDAEHTSEDVPAAPPGRAGTSSRGRRRSTAATTEPSAAAPRRAARKTRKVPQPGTVADSFEQPPDDDELLPA
jgi:23S rRNA (guanosine2251-2'-O)-methyltransferase